MYCVCVFAVHAVCSGTFNIHTYLHVTALIVHTMHTVRIVNPPMLWSALYCTYQLDVLYVMNRWRVCDCALGLLPAQDAPSGRP